MPEYIKARLQLMFMLLLCFMLQTGVYFKIWLAYAINLPIEMVAVYFHEISHGLVALLTGGVLYNIQLVFTKGGVCHCGSDILAPVIYSGYIGQVVWGMLIYTAFTRWFRKSVHTVPTIVVVLGLVSLGLWVRDFVTFGIVVMIIFFSAFVTHMRHLYEMQVCLRFISIYLILSGLIDPMLFYYFSLENRELWDGAVLADITGISEGDITRIWMTVSSIGLMYIWYFEGRVYKEQLVIKEEERRLLKYIRSRKRKKG